MIVGAPLDSTDSQRVDHRRYAVLSLYGLSALWGAAQVIAPENTIVYMANAIAFATAATLWYAIDRRQLEKPRLPVLNFLFFVAWPVASLVHLLLSRGLRGVGLWFTHAIGLSATMCLTFFPTVILLQWLGVLDIDALTGS